MHYESLLQPYNIEERSREVAMRSMALRWRAQKACVRCWRLRNESQAMLMKWSVIKAFVWCPGVVSAIPCRDPCSRGRSCCQFWVVYEVKVECFGCFRVVCPTCNHYPATTFIFWSITLLGISKIFTKLVPREVLLTTNLRKPSLVTCFCKYLPKK